MPIYKYFSLGSFLVSIYFIGEGFYKIFVYENSDSSDPINSYVGGDAYNFIINASYATGYFILALIFMVLGCTLLIVNTLIKLRQSFDSVNKREDEDLELLN